MSGEDDGAGADGWRRLRRGARLSRCVQWRFHGPGAEVEQQLHHMVGGLDVEIRERFVEQKQLGVGLQHAGKGSALPHALRVLADGARECGVQAHRAQRHLRRGGATAHDVFGALQRGKVAQVFQGGELVVEHGVVAHVGDAAALLARLLAEDMHRAPAGCDQPGKQPQ